MSAPRPTARAPEINLGDAVKVMLVDGGKASGEAVAARTTSDTEFLRAMSEIRNKTAAQALGGIGGRVTQARKRAAKIAADPKWCPVCKRDNSRSSRAIIKWHLAGHVAPRPPMEGREGDSQQSRPTP